MRVRVTLRVRVSARASNVASASKCVSRCELVYTYMQKLVNNSNRSIYSKTLIDNACAAARITEVHEQLFGYSRPEQEQRQ